MRKNTPAFVRPFAQARTSGTDMPMNETREGGREKIKKKEMKTMKTMKTRLMEEKGGNEQKNLRKGKSRDEEEDES